jgi:dTDP-4-dehydrorhamnose 3,5-epimerase-like enzyme
MKIKKYHHPKILTKNIDGVNNGYLVPIYNEHESPIAPAQSPRQVYLTVVSPGMTKGPHLHMQRWGLFTCIKGNIKIIIKTPQGYENYFSGEDHEYSSIQVPAGWAAALKNEGSKDAFILNMPSPAWTPSNPDDHPVESWNWQS